MANKAKNQFTLDTRISLFILSLSRHWLCLALTIIGLYATLPFVAPTLMKLGVTGPANVLYTLYSPMCHQFSFRSIFLYGEQTFYPREIAGTDLKPYEYYAAQIEGIRPGYTPDEFTPDFFMPARAFRGNEQMGYKTTLCARDAAIYVMLFLGGLIYAIPAVRRRLYPIPFWIYIIAGLGPIGLDGFSQLLSYAPFSLWPVRETAPFFRVATGAMFGLMNAWLAFPYLERSFWETRRELVMKLQKLNIKV
jgi:uncharacterized membrane protein